MTANEEFERILKEVIGMYLRFYPRIFMKRIR